MFSKEINQKVYKNVFNFIKNLIKRWYSRTAISIFSFKKMLHSGISLYSKSNLPFTVPDLSCTTNITQSAKFSFSTACMIQGMETEGWKLSCRKSSTCLDWHCPHFCTLRTNNLKVLSHKKSCWNPSTSNRLPFSWQNLLTVKSLEYNRS